MALQNDIYVVKQVGANGQISLGKEYAFKQVQLSKLEDGTLIIKTGKFVPDNEKWLHSSNNIEKLDRAIELSERKDRSDNFDEIRKTIENE